ncbi:MAG: enolase C-terminal domain-like protein [Polyangia bacterium]
MIRTLALPVGGAAHRASTREVLEVELRDEAGRIGRGEAAPLPGYSLDNLDSALRVIRLLTLALPRRFADLEEVESHLADATPSARAALECALLDLFAQQKGVPLWALLRGDGTAPALPLSAMLLGDDLVAEAAQLRDGGYVTLKRKIDASTRLDTLAGLGALRLDANRSLSPATWSGIAPTLVALAPELIEEPLDGDLRSVAAFGLPLGADESLAARTAALALTQLEHVAPSVRAAVLKPARDGLLGAWRLGTAARALGLQPIVTHMWDAPTGHLAALHVALALGDATSLAQGLAPQPALGAEQFAAIIRHGHLHPPQRPGLSDA